MDDLIIGIDLGTTNSVVAYNINDNIEIVRDMAGRALYPSVVAYKEDKIYTGYAATLFNPEYTVVSAKRLLGRSWNDKVCASFAHDIEAGPKGNIYIDVSGQWVTPQQVMKELLCALKRRTESILHRKCYNAVLTVPARFDNKTRSMLKNIAKDIGLKVLRIINEPTAAAIGYNINTHENGIYGVYDLGGGTFDFSLLSVGKNTYHVLSTGGSLDIGGDDFDNIMMNILKTKDIKLAREAKEQLSVETSIKFRDKMITREIFEKKAQVIINSTLDIIKQVIDDVAMSYKSISGILLVGGMTRMPLIKSSLAQTFHCKIHDDHNPEEIVAIGAARHANMIVKDKRHLLVDVLLLPIGVEVIGGGVDIVIPKQSPLPTSASRTYTTAQSGQTAMHFHIVQGEKNLAQNCISLGVFEVNNITPLNKNVARIKVDFHVDVNGILDIIAYEEGKDKHHIKINTRSNSKNISDIDDFEEWVFQQEKLYIKDLQTEVDLISTKHPYIDKNVKDNIDYLFKKANKIEDLSQLNDLKKIKSEIDEACSKLITNIK